MKKSLTAILLLASLASHAAPTIYKGVDHRGNDCDFEVYSASTTTDGKITQVDVKITGFKRQLLTNQLYQQGSETKAFEDILGWGKVNKERTSTVESLRVKWDLKRNAPQGLFYFKEGFIPALMTGKSCQVIGAESHDLTFIEY